MATRTERDTMGTVEVPEDRYWGAQTQRSLEHFDIGRDTFVWGRAGGPGPRSAQEVGRARERRPRQLLDGDVARAVVQAADEVHRGELDDHFPLVVFQTGSGTQSNMNANEVIANRAIELRGGGLGSKSPVHPNDDVNRGQSSNDTFPTAMHIAVVWSWASGSARPWTRWWPRSRQGGRRRDVVKVGRTHLQDATPVTLGQEIGGWVAQIVTSGRRRRARSRAYELAIGGTAVGTGLNAPAEFGDARRTASVGADRLPVPPAPNNFVAARGARRPGDGQRALRTLAGALMKMANDVRWLASGRAAASASCGSRRTSRAPRSCRARSTRPSPRR